MEIYNIITILVVLAAIFGYINHRYIKLPGSIGIMLLCVLASLIILALGNVFPQIFKKIAEGVASIDFQSIVLRIMLSFLLFAAAIQTDIKTLRRERTAIITFATLGVFISTLLIGFLLYFVMKQVGLSVDLLYCLLFGALISPTDPIAVSAILKNTKISPRLDTIISGESLFNDGVGLVLFVTVLTIAGQTGTSISFVEILGLFAREVLGGILIGLIIGFLGCRMINSIKNFQSILLISIALVLALSVIAHQFHASIPLAAVTAGLIIGNKSLDEKVAGKTNISYQFLSRIWQLIDEVLNTILFVMIGLQLVVMPFLNNYWLIGFISIVIILIARLISVSLPAVFILRKVNFSNFFILTWAGLRGGISVAMALSLPVSHYREVILSSCYFIVIFSIIVQGLTLNHVIKKATT